MSDKIKEAIEALTEKTKNADAPQAALEWSHAVLYLTQALHNLK